MTKKFICLLFAFILFISISFFLSHKVFSIECEPGFRYKDEEELRQIISSCEQKKNSLREKANTLSSQIQYMNTQIYLTTFKIQETEDQIKKTEEEMNILTSKIEGLDDSLNYLSKLLLKKIVEGYKNRSFSFLSLFLDSGNANELINRVKYLKTTQENNQKVLIQVQETKANFEEQKKLREEKKKKLDELQITLSKQKTDLDNQKFTKQRLLNDTQNDENIYQGLLEKARRELSGFSAFTQAAGGGTTTFGNGNNGWYYTQRDPQWGNMILPGSSSSVLLAGCAVSSVAMVCKSYGQGTTPATIAANPNNFIGGDLWNWAFSCSGKTTEWLGTSQDQVKSYVQNNTPVILRLIAPSVSGLHFIVVFGWDDEKMDFKIHDPYYGPDKYFSDRYSWSQVTTTIVIH